MNIVFLVVCSFPYGEASSVRALNICRLINLAGHNVHVIGDFCSKDNEQFDFCTYETLLQKNCSFFARQSVGKLSVERLKAYCNTNKVDAVLMNARYDRYDAVAAFCKQQGIKMLVENCEWYHSSSFKLGAFDLRYLKNQKMLTSGFKRADGFISISSFLHKHNQQFAPSVRIPTILDVVKSDYSLTSNNEKLQIVYTGSPGKSKEFLRPVCEALVNNEALRKNVVFNIYGPSYAQVIKNIKNEEILKQCGESVVIHGRVAQSEIENILKKADFLLFLRPLRRSSQAGFPTKLGESFAVGTPVIANDTGDIGKYITDGVNGFIACDTSAITIEKTLLKALDYKEKYSEMRKNARTTAENSFDFRVYENDLAELLNGVISND